MKGPALVLATLLPWGLSAIDLKIVPADLRVEADADGGFDLYVRAKPDLGSVLLVETTKDPGGKVDNFAYRSEAWNPVNGDELRMLNGKPLPPSGKLYSLISSKQVPDAAFGKAFHIYVPPVIVYGYPWSRSGTVSVGAGTFINLRAFQKPYGDYTGPFVDNPYSLVVTAKPLAKTAAPPPPPPPEPKPEPLTVALAEPAAEPPKVEATPLPPPEGPPSAQVGDALDALPSDSLDLVLCIDTTESMKPYLDDLKKNLIVLVRERVGRFREFRIGLVLFKDYWPDDYITMKVPFMTDLSRLDGYIQALKAKGGMDIPEAIHEALVAAATDFEWKAASRLVILVSDAPPHPMPRGQVTWLDAARALAERRIELQALVIPEVELSQ